jgi:hypothetical protein
MDPKQFSRLSEAYNFHLGLGVLLNCKASHTIPLLLSKLAVSASQCRFLKVKQKVGWVMPHFNAACSAQIIGFPSA